ncbi:MAG: hypothetical protein KTR15_15115 [Phycisphaeraceae bacterium]|nr:hypothetical protein [Phycisphaeraceae bacterium]
MLQYRVWFILGLFTGLLVGFPSAADLTDALEGAGETATDPPADTDPVGPADAPDAEPAAPGVELPNLSREEAMQLLDIWATEIARDQHALGRHYSYGKNSQRTLGNAFETVGAEDRHNYVESWAGWVYMDWSSASRFYTNQAHELRKSQSTIRKQGSLTPGQVNYLAQGMYAYRERHEEIAEVMAQRVQTTAYGLYYSELESHESEEVQALAKAAGEVNHEKAMGIHGRIRSYGNDLVFYAVQPDQPLNEYAPQEGLPPHNPVINAGGPNEVPMDELERMFNEDLARLKAMDKQALEGKQIDAYLYSITRSRLKSIANEIKARGGKVPAEIPNGPQRYDPNASAPKADKPEKLGPPPTKPVKPIALPDLGDSPSGKKFKKDVVDSEKALFEHMMQKRDKWTLDESLKWDGKRHELIRQATKSQQTLALAVAGSHTPGELKQLRAISKGLGELAQDRQTDKELSDKFRQAKKLMDDYVAVNESLKKAGAGHGTMVKIITTAKMPNYTEAAMKFGTYRAWHDAEEARRAMWKHQTKMNAKGRELMRMQKKLFNDRLMRGEKMINETLKQAGKEPNFRVHRAKDYTKTNGQAVNDLLGPSGRQVLIEQGNRRRQAGRALDKTKD